MIKHIKTLTLLAGLYCGTAFAGDSCELVLDVDFSQHKGDFVPYTQALANIDFNGIESVAAPIRGLDTPDKQWPARNTVGKGVLKAHYLKDIASGKFGGFLFGRSFLPTTEAVMEYRLKFEEGFEFRAGGKLPGLGGAGNPDIQIPVGCTKSVDRIHNGFSARLMWRRPNKQGEGKLVAYTYFPNRLEREKPKCGIDYSFGHVKPGKWYTVRQYIKLNTLGKKDGILEMSINGKKKLSLKDVEYRLKDKGDITINKLIMHTYRGGKFDDERFTSSKDSYVYMDDFKVWRNCAKPK